MYSYKDLVIIFFSFNSTRHFWFPSIHWIYSLKIEGNTDGSPAPAGFLWQLCSSHNNRNYSGLILFFYGKKNVIFRKFNFFKDAFARLLSLKPRKEVYTD